MSDLLDFLEARLTEDEQVATNAARPHLASKQWNTDPWLDGTGERCDLRAGALGQLTTHGGCLEVPAGEHAARHDPARVLRDIRAKQSVLFRHVTYATRVERAGDLDLLDLPERLACDGCGWDDGRPRTPSLDGCPELRALAAPYADHSDYRSEWAP